MATHAMIDLETLDVTPRASVLTVGGVKFDPNNDSEPHSEFYYKLDLDSQDRSVNDDTIAWWATQDTAVQEEAFSEEGRISLKQALEEMYPIIWNSNFIWANGPTFDMNIIEHAYKSYDMQLPWKFYKVRDARTVYSLWPGLPKQPVSHHALDDCRQQIIKLQQTFRHLGVTEIR